MGTTSPLTELGRHALLSQRLSSLRAGGIILLAMLLIAAQAIELPLAYDKLLLIGIEWLLLHVFVIYSERKWQITDLSISLQLLADISIVASLLALSGGVHNPFFALLLLPLLLSVGLLPQLAQYVLLTAILMAATLLMFLPSPASLGMPQLPNSLYALLFTLDGGVVREVPFNPLDSLRKIGLWLNIILMASLIAFFLSRLHQRLENQQQQLQQAERQATEQQHLLTLGLNAASTAHELSTPLATISLLASEAQDAYRYQEVDAADAALHQIQTLVQTCKQQISQSLAHAQFTRTDQLSLLPWPRYLQQLISHWQALRPQASVELKLPANSQSLVFDLPQLTQTITSLLNNAADASHTTSALTFTEQDDHVTLCLTSYGKTFTEAQLTQFPDPMISDKADGHGMGLHLAHRQISQLGGQLTICNVDDQQARVCITLASNPQEWQAKA